MNKAVVNNYVQVLREHIFLYIFNSLSEYLGVGLLDCIITTYVYNACIHYVLLILLTARCLAVHSVRAVR